MSRKGIKHTSEEKTVKGINYVQGVNVGYDVSVGSLTIPNVGFRSLRDVNRQLIEKGYRREDIKQERIQRKRDKTSA